MMDDSNDFMEDVIYEQTPYPSDFLLEGYRVRSNPLNEKISLNLNMMNLNM